MAERRSIQMSTYCFYSLFLGLLYFSTCCHGHRHVSYNMLELWAAPQDASYLVSDIQSHSGRQKRQAQNATTPSNDGLLDATAANATSPPATNESVTQEVSGNKTSSDPLDGAKVVEDDNDYYLVKSNIQEFDRYWKDLEDAVMHETLSSSHRMAAVIDLKFTFPFYGHAVQNVTVATGGFIYMSPFLHRWLTATQYIAPLMANFDTSLRSNSNILYLSLEDSFSVEWRNVVLQDQNETGLFTFQAILKSTGQIVFVYKDVPVNVANISESQHPVKVGVSDAYYSDSYIPDLGIKRRTIYEYHKVDVKERAVRSGSVVVIDPLPTCNILNDCSSCTEHQDVNFDCHWCNKIGRCSDGLDWYRQHWDRYGCPSTKTDDPTVCGDYTSTSQPQSSFGNMTVVMTTQTSATQVTPQQTTEPPTPQQTTEPPTTKLPTPQQTTEPPTTKVPTPQQTTEPPTPQQTTEPPTTKLPTPQQTTEPPTPQQTTEPPTPQQTTEPPTPQQTTEPPTTKLPTPQQTTEPPTPQQTTEPPTSKPPTTKAPTTKAPTTKPPTTKAPTTKPPTTKPLTMPTAVEEKFAAYAFCGFLNSSEVCGSLPPPSVDITDPINHPVPNPYEDDDCPNGKCGDGKSNVSVVLVVMIILLIAGLTAGIGGWVYYAYTHPTSKSGMWLMEHRPSQMRAKIQFWKSSSDSGAAKYKVETEA